MRGPFTFLGDSHAGVLGPLLAGLLSDPVTTVFHNGWSLKSYLDSGEISRVSTPALIIELGTNDRPGSAEELASQLAMLHDQIPTSVKQVAWIGPGRVVAESRSDVANWLGSPNLANRVSNTADMLGSMVVNMGWAWIDSRLFDLPEPSDGVHYNGDGQKGYRAWAANIAQSIAGIPDSSGVLNAPSIQDSGVFGPRIDVQSDYLQPGVEVDSAQGLWGAALIVLVVLALHFVIQKRKKV